ncbi:MAG: PilZ domain-containing protein [Candidatus Omnitrophica bacterium]|nr:PilZ domain-containing protein [Candidatus Omnitrophota bacterium]
MEKEKRKFKRFDAFLGVRYKVTDDSPKQCLCLSRDLSREGMKMTLTEELKRGTVFDMEIDIPDDPKPVHTSAEVVWSHPSGPSGGGDKAFDIGIRFLMMDPVDKFRVLDFAYNHWLETKVNDFSDPEKVSELA